VEGETGTQPFGCHGSGQGSARKPWGASRQALGVSPQARASGPQTWPPRRRGLPAGLVAVEREFEDIGHDVALGVDDELDVVIEDLVRHAITPEDLSDPCQVASRAAGQNPAARPATDQQRLPLLLPI
jgi:hypothetical protein